ncbi:hypothetical protein [Blastococcus sp. CT_GayMR16]|uniref:hypothetical protein n=1 Tax=Blastococcus sp. CT_GayMR16 TaxID=2559607 RepID=UPI00107300F2|nr:hypothetical protein [Blastococcus sp. CT_GayMR16]TFV83180.1 hypothetical protein E4P38_21220 [Blastococcus sp. CT_GayMR16]
MSAGDELDEIMRDLDRTTAEWSAAGYGYGTPEDDAREGVFARLKEWNTAHDAKAGPGRAHPDAKTGGDGRS